MKASGQDKPAYWKSLRLNGSFRESKGELCGLLLEENLAAFGDAKEMGSGFEAGMKGKCHCG